MTATLHATEYVEGLRPVREQLETFVRILDDHRGQTPRAHERLVIQGRLPMLFTIDHPGGSTGRFRIFPFDLSVGGLGFFHRGFVHTASHCTFDLRNAAHQPVRVHAAVASCTYLMGAVHFVGVRFEVPIQPAKLLGDLGDPHAPDHARSSPRRRPRPIDPWFEQARELCRGVESAVESQACRELVRDRAEALREFLKR